MNLHETCGSRDNHFNPKLAYHSKLKLTWQAKI